jgi:hypothetical protein
LKRWLFADVELEMTDSQREASQLFAEIMHSETPRRAALRHVAEIVCCYSARQKEGFAQTKDRLEDARHLFSQLLSSVVSPGIFPGGADHNTADSLMSSLKLNEIWQHRTDLHHELFNTGYEETNDTFLYRPYIHSVAAAVIERPWLDSHFMEWVIVDSLVCDEVRQFGRSILEGKIFRLRDVFLVGRDALDLKGIAKILIGIARAMVIRWLVRLLLFLALPVFGIWYGARSGTWWLLYSCGTVAVIYLCCSGYITLRAGIMRLFGRQLPKTRLQIKLELWTSMHDAYRMLNGPLIDPTRVNRALEAAAEKGAVWDGAVYAVLNRVIARDPAAWVTDDSHTYRGREDQFREPSTA